MLPLHRASSAASLAASDRAQKRWDLLRMHFLEYPMHSKALTRQKWHSLAESALERSRELRHRRQVRASFFLKLTCHVLGAIGKTLLQISVLMLAGYKGCDLRLRVAQSIAVLRNKSHGMIPIRATRIDIAVLRLSCFMCRQRRCFSRRACSATAPCTDPRQRRVGPPFPLAHARLAASWAQLHQQSGQRRRFRQP